MTTNAPAEANQTLRHGVRGRNLQFIEVTIHPTARPQDVNSPALPENGPIRQFGKRPFRLLFTCKKGLESRAVRSPFRPATNGRINPRFGRV
jgi:hypothetical protein